jgi:YesN/AraC family two-component response regulator
LALRRIKLALQAIPDVEIVGAASDGAQAITQMRDLRPDVVLLDIKMPLADGFEVANAVEDSGGPEVIFVSAFDSYAVQAFETSAVDYLVKPVEFERLASALGRARRIVRRNRAASTPSTSSGSFSSLSTPKNA